MHTTFNRNKHTLGFVNRHVYEHIKGIAQCLLGNGSQRRITKYVTLYEQRNPMLPLNARWTTVSNLNPSENLKVLKDMVARMEAGGVKAAE